MTCQPSVGVGLGPFALSPEDKHLRINVICNRHAVKQKDVVERTWQGHRSDSQLAEVEGGGATPDGGNHAEEQTRTPARSQA